MIRPGTRLPILLRRARALLSRRSRGVAALDFALVGSLFFFVLFGIIQIGGMEWTTVIDQDVAWQTARCAGIGSCAAPETFAKNRLASYALSGTAQSITVNANAATCNGMSLSSGHFVSVSVVSRPWLGVEVISNMIPHGQGCYPVIGPAGG